MTMIQAHVISGDEARALLKGAIYRVGSQTRLARKIRTTQADISWAKTGKRPITGNAARHLGVQQLWGRDLYVLVSPDALR